MKNFLVLEDSEGTRLLLRDILHEVFGNDISLSEAKTLQEGLSYVRDINSQFDVALIDVELPDGSGIDCLREIKRIMSKCLCVIVTLFEDKYLVDAMGVGADGFLVKKETKESLVNTLSKIFNNEPPCSPKIARLLLQYFKANVKKDEGDHTSPDDESVRLTKREEEALTCIGSGYSDQETAEALNIKPNTVKTHIKSIYNKLDISTRAEAGAEAKRRDLVP